ncbi:MAG: restriction endonuclease subunit S [Bacteroidales bacterium]|nr:restriction endonuclease subunit S [Bacteroidales bacterium]
MTGKQLKNAILQLAIQGKLIPQDAADEPASALLARIRKEKEQLVKAGKLKKKDLETTPISDEEKPFEIPESWEWCRWGDLSFSIQYGYNASAQTSGDIRMVRISDIQNNEVLWNSVPYCKINADEIDTYLLEENDILFARTGGTVGKSFLVKKVPYPAIYAGYLIRTRYSKNLIPQYLKSFMESSIYWDQLRDGTIATAQPNCNGKTLSKMLIPLPPLAEQHRIVAKIEELMPLVEEYGVAQEKLNQLNEALPEALKKSILQQAIQGELVPQDANDEPASALLAQIRKEKEQLVKAGKLKKKDLETTPITDEEKPFEIPERWEWVRLGELLSTVSDGTHKTPTYVEKGIPFLSVQNISSGTLNLTKIKYVSENEHRKLCERIQPQIGDILVCRIGTLGKAIEINWDFEFSIFVSLGLLRPIDKDVNAYIVFFINSPAGHAWIDKVKVGGGTHTYKINLSDFPNMLIPLPPLAEQHRIVSKIEELMAMVDGMK